jgi:hypothetical protein
VLNPVRAAMVKHPKETKWRCDPTLPDIAKYFGAGSYAAVSWNCPFDRIEDSQGEEV